jgi:predicted XRE-type DNA-binding protein
MKNNDTTEYDSGNVFSDLGLPDAEVLQMKAYLSICIEQEIKARGLSQTEAAKILNIRQPKLSALLRGGFDAFTLDRLVRYLNRLGQEVELVVKRTTG